MDEKLTSRDCSPPISRNSSSSFASKGCRELITKSAPRRLLDCSWIARSRFVPSEPMAVSAAIPSTIEHENSTSLRRLARLSRHAMRQVQGESRALALAIMAGGKLPAPSSNLQINPNAQLQILAGHHRRIELRASL